MEVRQLKPRKSPKVRKIVYIDETCLRYKADAYGVVDWLAEYFDVYIVKADGLIHLLRGDYLISPIQYSPAFHGEWLSFRQKDVKDLEKPQIDWLRVKEYFMEVVKRGENVGDADYDMTLLSMLRSKLRYEDENNE